MQRRPQGALGLLRMIVAASVVIPVALFAYTCWETYQSQLAKADLQIDSTLDIAETHARNLFQTSDLAIQAVDDLVAGLSDQEILDRSEEFRWRFQHIENHLAQIRAIWLFDRNGHALANSRVSPNPRQIDFSGRSYFAAQKTKNAGFFVGQLVKPVIAGAPFFAVSRRRASTKGSFDGVVAIALAPSYFRDLYNKIGYEFPRTISLVLANGATLVSDPPTSPAPPWRNEAHLRQAAGLVGNHGLIGESNGQRFGLRKVAGYPVFIATSIRDAAIRKRTAQSMEPYLIFGVPATLALVALALAAIRNTKRLSAEAERRELAESALKQTQRLEALGQLTGGVAHDINNLLMIVGGNAELASKEAVSPRQLQRLAAVAAAVERGRALTRQLLTFSRRQSVDPASTDLRDHLVRTRTLFDASLGARVSLRLEIAPDLWYVRIDRDELDIALLNLVVNAKDAMPEGGVLTLKAFNVPQLPTDVAPGELAGPFVALSVIDGGVGMPADVLERAFEPFFTTKPSTRGNGLGLSQVYGFCQQAGGVATIRSRLGQGTTITLYLPKWNEAPLNREREAPDLAACLPRSGRALLVEDNAAVGELARDHLEDLGFEVTWAQHAEAALQILAEMEAPVGLVMSDIVMPGQMNGVQLAREIRRSYPRMPILLMTGYAPYLMGAVEEFQILRKPFTRPSLEAALARAFQGAAPSEGPEAATQLPLI